MGGSYVYSYITYVAVPCRSRMFARINENVFFILFFNFLFFFHKILSLIFHFFPFFDLSPVVDISKTSASSSFFLIVYMYVCTLPPIPSNQITNISFLFITAIILMAKYFLLNLILKLFSFMPIISWAIEYVNSTYVHISLVELVFFVSYPSQVLPFCSKPSQWWVAMYRDEDDEHRWWILCEFEIESAWCNKCERRLRHLISRISFILFIAFVSSGIFTFTYKIKFIFISLI